MLAAEESCYFSIEEDETLSGLLIFPAVDKEQVDKEDLIANDILLIFNDLSKKLQITCKKKIQQNYWLTRRLEVVLPVATQLLSADHNDHQRIESPKRSCWPSNNLIIYNNNLQYILAVNVKQLLVTSVNIWW